MADKNIEVCYGVDIDAVVGWIGCPTKADSICDISRGVWTARVGIPNLFDLFRRYNIKTTCFTPGYSLFELRRKIWSSTIFFNPALTIRPIVQSRGLTASEQTSNIAIIVDGKYRILD